MRWKQSAIECVEAKHELSHMGRLHMSCTAWNRTLGLHSCSSVWAPRLTLVIELDSNQFNQK